jgi:hypothetical protein
LSESKARILIATPSHREAVAVNYFISVLNATSSLFWKGIDLDTYVKMGDPILHLARSCLVAEFLSRPACTHLLFVDDDVGFQYEQIIRMVEFDQDFVGAILPMRREAPGHFWLEGGLFADQEPEIRGAFISAAWAPTAFLLLKRSVITTMIEAYPDLAYFGRPNAETGEKPVRYDLFQPMRNPAGFMLEEDLSFCARWRAIGGRIWLDGEGILTHSIRSLKYCTTPPGPELLKHVRQNTQNSAAHPIPRDRVEA